MFCFSENALDFCVPSIQVVEQWSSDAFFHFASETMNISKYCSKCRVTLSDGSFLDEFELVLEDSC